MVNVKLWAGLAALAMAMLVEAGVPSDKRVAIYYQTGLGSGDDHVSLLPLIQQSSIDVSYIMIAAVHVMAGSVHINDNDPSDPIFDTMWSEVAQLQAAGVTVGAMVGGAAAGSWPLLDGSDDDFATNYAPIHDMIASHNLQGLDLDVEQSFSLDGCIRLINQLKSDFGSDFIITLAPVATALTEGGGNLSGFSYFDLESQAGDSISWYNAQFYDGWGDASSTSMYQSIVDDGFPANKVVMGLLSNSAEGSGFVDLDTEAGVLSSLISEYSDFGGVANWEYYNSEPGGTSAPYEWASWAAESMGTASSKIKREIGTTEALVRRVKHSARHVRGMAKKFYRDYIA
ncbi:glycoside hydrolase superfamily [Xylariaceae sp. FL0255]|nr:glycoside hydrolase superfamily [Xylariaceae sp. FL0255]